MDYNKIKHMFDRGAALMGEMFGTNRYLTKGVAHEVGVDIQLLLWMLIDKRKKMGAIDYLQIFELTIETHQGKQLQKIVHSQEVPSRKDEYLADVILEPLNRKIWVIDSGEYCTMLFPQEY
jgi:hypothetical protein